MAKLIVELPEEIHRELKRKSMLHHRTIKEVVTALVGDYLSREEQKKETTETGLCGAWEDPRKAEDIIAEIKSHRRWFGKRGRKVA